MQVSFQFAIATLSLAMTKFIRSENRFDIIAFLKIIDYSSSLGFGGIFFMLNRGL